MLLAKNS